MARGGAGRAGAEDAPSGAAQGQGDSKGGKRRCVQSACVPCRKRKSKCDGGTPVCATCTAVYKTECHYDGDSESRRARPSGAVKRDHASVEPNENAEFLINNIRNLPESEVTELIQHIRREKQLDLPDLVESWKKTVTLLPSNANGPTSLEGELSMLLGKPALTQTGISRHFGTTSGMGLVAEDENYTRSSNAPTAGVMAKHQTWTNITNDLPFVHRILDLYFRWSHPFYVVFSRECFLKDFQSGRQKYCSPLLVNAILAYGCHFSDEPEARTDPDDFRTAGNHFFAEARRLLFEDETPCLTTTQALCVMALREPSAGRDSAGFMYIGRTMRMAVELGLHLNHGWSPALGLTPSELEVRKVTFWGCFTVDTAWSVCIGRISQLPRAAITLDKPILDEPIPGEKYQIDMAHNGPATVTSRMFLQEFSSLSELVSDNIHMFFAPRERFTSRRLLDTYNKYLNWYNALPQALQLPDNPKQPPQPHIATLHMYYNTIILHLFRPLLKVDLVHSDLRPRDITIQSANRVSDILRKYREFYPMRRSHLVVTHVLLSVCIVHLLFSQEYKKNADNLEEGLRALEEMSVCHYFGGRAFKIVHALAKTWNLPFPESVQRESKLLNNTNDRVTSPPVGQSFAPPMAPPPPMSLPPSDPNSNGYPTEHPNNNMRRESLTMFAPDHHPFQTLGGSGSLGGGFAPPSSAMPYVAHSAPLPTSSPHEVAERLFWTPIQGMGVPLLPRNNYQMSPMDLNNMLGNVDEWDRFSRDGFKMSAHNFAQEPMSYGGNEPTCTIPPQGQDTLVVTTAPAYEGWWAHNGVHGQ